MAEFRVKIVINYAKNVDVGMYDKVTWDTQVTNMGHMAAQNMTWAGASQKSCETHLLSKLGGSCIQLTIFTTHLVLQTQLHSSFHGKKPVLPPALNHGKIQFF